MANIHKDLEKNLENLGITYILRNTLNYSAEDIPESEADEITVYKHYDDDGNYDLRFYSYKLPKSKLVDVEWIMNKWSKSTDNTYETFTKDFKKILDKKGYKNGISVYPTTYGIGIFVVFTHRDQIENIKKDIEGILTEYEIDYKTTTSEAGWVFQYRISKSKENINKLKQIEI